MHSNQYTFSTSDLPILLDHVIEGTPFVPFAILIDLLARSLEIKHTDTLVDINVVAPIMLRKNRNKTVIITVDQESAMIKDNADNIYVTAKIISEQNTLTDIIPSNHTKDNFQTTSLLNKSVLYPKVLFHGPSLQANFNFLDYNKQKAIVELTDFTISTPALGCYFSNNKTPIILIDLAFQAAALHLLKSRSIYALPTTCKSLFINLDFKEITKKYNKIQIAISYSENNIYDINAIIPNIGVIFTCKCVKFQGINRKVSNEIIDILHATNKVSGNNLMERHS